MIADPILKTCHIQLHVMFDNGWDLRNTHATATKLSSAPQVLFNIPLVYIRATTKSDPIAVGMMVPERIWARVTLWPMHHSVEIVSKFNSS